MGHSSVNNRLENIRQDRTKTTSEHQQPTYSTVAKWVRVGILPKDYPQIQLTVEQLHVVQEAILLKVTQQRRESFKPKFTNCWQRTGHLVVNCQDTETADWLDSVVPTLTLWEAAELTVVDADDIPRLDVLIGFFPQSVNNDNDTIRIFIESQNDGLRTDKWRIIQRKTLYEKHVEWSFTVDEASMQHFKACNFLINYKFGQTSLRKKGMYKPGSDEIVDCSDETKGQDPTSCASSGYQHSHSVPTANATDGNLPKVVSSKNQQNSELAKDQNHQLTLNDRNRPGTLKGSGHSGPVDDQKPSGPSKDQKSSGMPMNQNFSKSSKARNISGPSNEKHLSGFTKNQIFSELPKDQSLAVPSKDRKSSGTVKDQNLPGRPKNEKTPRPSKD